MAKILRVGLLTPPDRLDPKAPQHETMLVLHQIVEAPYGVSVGSEELEPRLFDGPLERVGQGQPPVYRARVRAGVVFSDGLPLGAHHVAASLRQSPLLREQAYLGVEDPWLTFTLKRPNARFDLALSHVQCSVFRQRGDSVIGSGPFQVAPDSRPERVHLLRNPHARRRPPLDEVVFEVFPPDAEGRPAALFEALQRGDVDVTPVLPRNELGPLQGVRKTVLPGLSTAVLYLNTESPRLRDARLRRAVAQAVDRTALAGDVYSNALAFAAKSLLPRGLHSTPMRDGLTFDLKRAQALLAECGGAPPELSLLLTWAPRPYLPNPRRTAELIAAQLRPLGIRVELVPTNSVGEFMQGLAQGRQDLVLGGWTADTLDPSDFLEANLSSERIVTRGENLDSANNIGRLRSPAMDAALGAYRAERTPQALEAVARLLTEEAPLLPLFYGSTAIVHSFRVTGLKPSPLALLDLSDADLTG